MLTGLRHITSTGWTTRATPDAPVTSFDLRTIGSGSLLAAIPFIAFDIILIATGRLAVQIIGLGMLGLTAYGFFVRKAVRQEVRLETDGIAVQMGIGPAFRVRYDEMSDAREIEFGNGWLIRSNAWIAKVAHMPYGYPYVRVFLKRRKFRLGWIPIPAPAYAKTVVLGVWQTAELTEELQKKITPQTGWTIPTPRSA